MTGPTPGIDARRHSFLDREDAAVLTTSNPTGVNGPLFEELTATLPGAPVVDRVVINAWHDPAFVDAVDATGRRQLIMAGVTSDVCLTFPAVAAAAAGYDVWAVIDASGAVSPHALYASMARMSRGLIAQHLRTAAAR